MPSVVIVSRGCSDGGSVAAVSFRHAEQLAVEFCVRLVCDSLPLRELRGVEVAASPYRQYPFLRRFAHVPNELSYARAMVHAIRRVVPAPDLVISHSHTVVAALPARTSYAVALVVHGDIFDRPAGMFDPRLAAYYRWAEPRAYRRADLTIALSEPVAVTARRFGAPRVAVVPNGIDLAQWPEGKVREISVGGELRLLYVGRLSPEKGVDLLLDAVATLATEGMRFGVNIVGDGPADGALRAQAHGLGLDEIVRFHGSQDHAAVLRFMHSSTLLCIPSRSEVHPLVALEALATGLPVVACRVGGIPSLVHDSVNGVLADTDSASFAAAIRRAAVPPTIRSMSAASRPSVQRYDWSAVGVHLRREAGEIMQRELSGGREAR